jgi:translation initiation factor IF-3
LKPNVQKELPPINENIKATRLQVITHEGQNLGVIEKQQALRLANAAELDLVLLADQGAEGVPVAKIMDYGKVLYEKKKKAGEAKKHQKTVQVKEIQIRPKIGIHDFQTKMNQAVKFLEEGKHVKITLVFRGREMATKDTRGTELFDQVQKMLDDLNLTDIVFERDSRIGSMWSRVYYKKNNK